MAEVSLYNISKIYTDSKTHTDEKKAVSNVSFVVHDKEFVVLVGPSGCGKSTLLRMIAGLEEISEGFLLIDDKKVNEIGPAQRDIAMVFQNYALYPHMTVYENMAFGLKLKRLNKNEINKRIMETALLLELQDELHRKPASLSGGQRQRVAIGRAIIRRPKVFLFDEPLSNLDAKLRSQMRIELQRLHREINATIIYVTHDQTEAMTLGNRIVVLNKGHIIQIDTPMNLYKCPNSKFVASFIGSPAMNFIKGYLDKKDQFIFVLLSSKATLQISYQLPNNLLRYVGKNICLGIRPEDIVISHDTQTSDLLLRVTAFENMGNEQLIYCTADDLTIIVRTAQLNEWFIGQPIGIHIPVNKVLYFDENTENVIEIG